MSRALVGLILLLVAGPAAASNRFAVVIGDNQGDRDEVELRYAESDARRVAEVLRSVGGFYPENVQLLTSVTGDDLRRALIALNARLRQEEGPSLLFVFYSGHGDADSLHLAHTRLPLAELRALVTGSPAQARMLVIDACRSGAMTRVKGGRIRAPFDIIVENERAPEGLAILTSSAAGEDAQESDELRASIFTHHFVSALLGAADRDGDGRVTVGETFAYAAERTLATTAFTLPGPQHPTYRLALGGRDDLVLTMPGVQHRGVGSLQFAAPGRFLVQQQSASGPIVAELSTARSDARLLLPAGRYFVTERARDYLRQASFTIRAGEVTPVDSARLERLEYARVVRKGGVERKRAVSLFAMAGARGQLLDLGTAWRTDVGARLDLRAISLELRLALGGSEVENDRLRIASWETTASVAALHVFDVGPVALGIGLEAGIAQRPPRPRRARRTARGPALAPAGLPPRCRLRHLSRGDRQRRENRRAAQLARRCGAGAVPMTARLLCLSVMIVAGCGDGLVGGDFLGDATIRLRGSLPTVTSAVEHPLVGVVWLGYEALLHRTRATISTARVRPSLPPLFTFDVVDRPSSVGVYLENDGTPIDATIRLARLVFVDDVDGDGTLALDDNLVIAAPDRLIAEADRHLLLYFTRDPARSLEGGRLLDDWSAVREGANLIEREPAVAPPALRARVIAAETPVVFDLPSGTVAE
jgi:hypothetical protein